MPPSFPEHECSWSHWQPLSCNAAGGVARFPSSVCRGSVKTLPSVAGLAVTSHSSQMERRWCSPYSPSLATFEKDRGTDQERSLLFSLPSANPGRLWRPPSPAVLQETSPFPVGAGPGSPLPQRGGRRPLSVVLRRGWGPSLQRHRRARPRSGRASLPRARGGDPRGAGFGALRAGWRLPGTRGCCGAPGGTRQGEKGESPPPQAMGGQTGPLAER